MQESIPTRVAALQTMSTHELKALWQTLYTTEPPPFNTAYFKTRLAYRLQELAFGGLGEEVKLHLEQLPADKCPCLPVTPTCRWRAPA